MTISGFTCAFFGKPGIVVGKTIFRFAARRFQTPTDCGMFQSALSVTRYLLEASGVGYVSTPSPVVTCTGVPPFTGTAQICRTPVQVTTGEGDRKSTRLNSSHQIISYA